VLSVWRSILRVAGGCFGIMAWIMIAGPQVTHDHIPSQETTAVSAIRTVHTVQVQYFSQYGRYALSLTELGPPTSGTPGPAAAGLIDRELASGTRNGYRFTMTGDASGYVIHADPETYGKSGSRTFYSDQTMVIRQNDGSEPATANSPEMKN
jgi:type IV pilus assembly protein PilA